MQRKQNLLGRVMLALVGGLTLLVGAGETGRPTLAVASSSGAWVATTAVHTTIVARVTGGDALGANGTPQFVHSCSSAPVGFARCHAIQRIPAQGNGAQPDVTPNTTPPGYGPSDLRSAYKLTSSGSSSTTVAIVDAYDNPHAESDLAVDPGFVNPGKDDYRLRPDTPLTRVGGFAYLGALAPAN